MGQELAGIDPQSLNNSHTTLCYQNIIHVGINSPGGWGELEKRAWYPQFAHVHFPKSGKFLDNTALPPCAVTSDTCIFCNCTRLTVAICVDSAVLYAFLQL